MADDDMEISSEHGHNNGEEDIDIDLDLTAGGQVDEDFVLEDAASNAEFGDNDFHPQPSAPGSNDDLMIDEDSTLYLMDDTDLIEDEGNQNMDHEVIAMSFAAPEVPHDDFGGSDLADHSNFPADDSNREVELVWEPPEDPEVEKNEAAVQLQKRGETLHNDDGDSENTLRNDDRDQSNEAEAVAEENERTTDRSHQSSRVHSPNHSAPAVVKESLSPSAKLSDPIPSTQNSRDHPEPSRKTNSIAEVISGQFESTETNSSLPIHKVVVVYQSIEYALFSTSESDDPDTFFLSDLSVLGEPLCNFFKAIRNIIQEDLADEDELCLSVEDLGLELDETSALIQDVTLGQILSLYRELLKNDGMNSLRPLHTILGIKPNFTRRLANLAAGAAQGRGLSELISWDEHSESHDDSAQVPESKQDDESDNIHGGASDDATAEINDNILGTVANDGPAHSTEDQELDSRDSQRSNGTDLATTPAKDAHDLAVAQPAITSDIQPLKKTETSGSEGYDEDGDLIDYSEDDFEKEQMDDNQHHISKETHDGTHNGTFEDFIPLCLKPNTCFCSKCNVLLLAEYEAVNNELRRRSLSRSAEDKGLDQSTDWAGTAETEINAEGNQLEVQSGTEYKYENYGKESEHGDVNLVSADVAVDGDDVHISAVEHEDHDEDFFGDDEGGHEVLEVGDDAKIDPDGVAFALNDAHGATEEEQINEHTLEAFEEDVELGEDDDTQNLALLNSEGKTTSGMSRDDIQRYEGDEFDGAFPQKTNSKPSSLGGVDGAEPESVLSSENVLETQTTDEGTNTWLNEEQEDEIDYEDDENDEEPALSESQYTSGIREELSLPNGSAGKRSRADEDLEDAMPTRSKAKRPRS